MRRLTNFYDFRFTWTATSAIGIHPTKTWLSQLVNFKNAIWTWGHFRRTICNKIASDCFWSILHESSISFWDSRKAGSLWGIMRGVAGVSKSIHQSWLAKGLGLGLVCCGFKGVQEEIPWDEASTLQIGSVAFQPGQDTSPKLHPCQTIWARWASRQFLTVPIVQTLLPVTFGYSLSSEAVVMGQLRRWKTLWRKSMTRSHKRTSMGPCRSFLNGTTSELQPEDITSKGTRVSCVYYQ